MFPHGAWNTALCVHAPGITARLSGLEVERCTLSVAHIGAIGILILPLCRSLCRLLALKRSLFRPFDEVTDKVTDKGARAGAHNENSWQVRRESFNRTGKPLPDMIIS